LKVRDAILLLGAAGVVTLVYGALVEANRLVLERKRIRLHGWPASHSGVKLAVLADLHVRDRFSAKLATRAVAMAIAARPDFVLIPGDLVARWSPGALEFLIEVLFPLAESELPVIVSLGNHDSEGGSADQIVSVCEGLGFRVLTNQACRVGGITFAGIESANLGRDRAETTMEQAKQLGGPIVVLWHEPDVVDRLPSGARLMISGHSHGGQFTFPGGFTPMHTKNGRKYVRGYYPDAPTPLYVSRGVGTTGPPSRLNCPPEVTLLELIPQSGAK